MKNLLIAFFFFNSLFYILSLKIFISTVIINTPWALVTCDSAVGSLSCYFSCPAEYGEKENDQLRERFNINKEDFPVYKLFKQNEATPIDFKGEVKADELSKFVKANTRLWIGMCVHLYVIFRAGFCDRPRSNVQILSLKLCKWVQ